MGGLCEADLCEAEVRGQSGRPKWEAEVGGRARPWEAEVGGRARPIWEAVRGQSGRPCEAEVRGHVRGRSGRPVGGRSGRPKWEACVGGRKWEANGRLWE